MKKILIFSLAYAPHVGGAEIAIKEITDRLPEIEFHLLTLRFGNEPKEEKIGNVFAHRVGKGGSYVQKILFVLRAARAALELQREHHFDLWWAMMTYMTFPVALARIAGARVPYVITLQDGDPFRHVFGRWRLLPFLPLLRSGFANASAVQAISSYLASWASRAGFTGNAVVVPNGVDLELFSDAHSRERRMETLRLITTSRLVHKNAVDDIVRALVLLPKTVTLSVYGQGPEESALRALAQELAVEDRVTFHGTAAHRDIPKLLREADIFIRPSRSEGMGISFLEAMAAGVPVVATQEGGIADFLFDAERNSDKKATGWAVRRDTPEDIARAVKNIMLNASQTEATVDRARALVTRQYSWTTVSEKMREVFEGAVKAGSMAV